MKKFLLPTLSFLALALVLSSSMCAKDDLTKEKSYECKCTYVAVSNGPSSGQANKEESTTLKGTEFDGLEVDCANLEGKYMAQYFSGTCTLLR